MREFIRDNWHTTVQHCTADTATLIGLPYPYTVPTAGAMFREMYYWDTFFTNEGLVRDGHPELAKGNTDNLLYMVRRFGEVYNEYWSVSENCDASLGVSFLPDGRLFVDIVCQTPRT
mgnify:CR=1 FL=1